MTTVRTSKSSVKYIADPFILLFSLTLFLSAGLTFTIQPMIGKMLLPLVGGAPSGWLMTMVYFQIALLAGYAIAHALSRAAVLHHVLIVGVLLFVGLISFPLNLNSDLIIFSGLPEALGVLLALAAGLTLPCVALFTLSPTLQRLFESGSARTARDPYFLFAASNLGSFVGLLAYPLWIERTYGLTLQSQGWQTGYAALMLLFALCLTAAYGQVKKGKPAKAKKLFSSTISWRQRGLWILQTAIPSSLLLGVTAHITVDQGSLPFFWVLPLALYLLTFVFAFARYQFVKLKYLVAAQPFVLIFLILAFLISPFAISTNQEHLFPPVIVFFVTALTCHTWLAASKPAPKNLTEFYLWVAAGGALGGCFNAFIAPYIFPLPVEFILVALLGSFILPGGAISIRKFIAVACIGGLLASIAMVLYDRTIPYSAEVPHGIFNAELILTGLACYLTNPGRFARFEPRMRFYLTMGGILLSGAMIELAILSQVAIDSSLPSAAARVLLVAILAYISFWPRTLIAIVPVLGLLAMLTHNGPHLVAVKRNFFGVWRIYDEVFEKQNITGRVLYHGSTKHGVEKIAPKIDVTPHAYYDKPLRDLMELFRPSDVGLLGLGAGTVLCYEAPNRHYTVYEIDPDIVKLAAEKYDYMRLCGTPEIHIGDGRRLLTALKNTRHDMLIMDSFSSDTIPLHLITKEALQIYFERMKPNGILAINISNRYYDLRLPISNLLYETGLHGLFVNNSTMENPLSYGSTWAVVARSDAKFGKLRAEGWKDLPPPQGRVWTDDYSDAISALNFSSLFR